MDLSIVIWLYPVWIMMDMLAIMSLLSIIVWRMLVKISYCAIP